MCSTYTPEAEGICGQIPTAIKILVDVEFMYIDVFGFMSRTENAVYWFLGYEIGFRSRECWVLAS